MSNAIENPILDQIFLSSRSFSEWLDQPVPETTLRKLYDVARLGPTSTNCNPGRFAFVTTPQAKARLLPTLWETNRRKVETAPVTVIVAWDTRFYDHVPDLFVHRPEVAESFSSNPSYSDETAFRNSSLQGAYLITAARGLGLDCGPLSGFDNAAVDAAFFPDGRWRSNFMINLGYGDRSKLFPRLPRLDFETACQVI